MRAYHLDISLIQPDGIEFTNILNSIQYCLKECNNTICKYYWNSLKHTSKTKGKCLTLRAGTVRPLTRSLYFISHQKDRDGTSSRKYGYSPTWTFDQIPDLILEPFSHKFNALPTELLGLPSYFQITDPYFILQNFTK